MSFVLKLIPMPVLYGVFLYMGVASLNGIQFFDRILLFFMPKKYQPDFPYLRKVQLTRVHLFTGVQLASLVGLWVIKDIKQTSILFPIMLVVMMGIRKLLDFVFTRSELKVSFALDQVNEKRHTLSATEVRTFAILCSKMGFFKKSVLRLVRVEFFHFPQGPEVVPIEWTLIQERIFFAEPTSTQARRPKLATGNFPLHKTPLFWSHFAFGLIVRVEVGRTQNISLLHQCPSYRDYFWEK